MTPLATAVPAPPTPVLDPQVAAILALAAGLPGIHTLPVEAGRERMRLAARRPPPRLAVDDVVSRRASTAGALPVAVRCYRGSWSPAPLVVFLHGGGWALGDLETHDALCRHLARTTGAHVVAVDYRRAPEHRHPAALDDAETVLRWALARPAQLDIDPERVVLVGDSAGGHLATGLARRAARSGIPIALQVLLYPITDAPSDGGSYAERAAGFGLGREAMEHYWRSYVPADAERWADELRPLHAPADRLAPAVVVTAEFDPLRDEGIAYAAHLEAAGVAVAHRHVPDLNHGFYSLPPDVARAEEERAILSGLIVDALGRAGG